MGSYAWAYNYHIEYEVGSDHSIADVLSRLPLPVSPVNIPTPVETVLLMDMLHSLPVTAKQISHWMDRDPLLSKVHTMVLKGW